MKTSSGNLTTLHEPLRRGEPLARPLLALSCRQATRRVAPTGGRAGFSLVEISLALAVLAIGLIAILGLFPHGLQSSRDAADMTVVATAINDVFSQLRTEPFTNATLGVNFRPSGPYNLRTETGTVSNYYDKAGFEVPLANTGNRYFKVLVKFDPETGLELTRITATVVWPEKAVAPINTNIFISKIAWYDR